MTTEKGYYVTPQTAQKIKQWLDKDIAVGGDRGGVSEAPISRYVQHAKFTGSGAGVTTYYDQDSSTWIDGDGVLMMGSNGETLVYDQRYSGYCVGYDPTTGKPVILVDAHSTDSITFRDDVSPSYDSVTSGIMALNDSVVTDVSGVATYQINTAAPSVPLGLVSDTTQVISGQKTFDHDVVVTGSSGVYITYPQAAPSGTGCLVGAGGQLIAISPTTGGSSPQIMFQDSGASGNASMLGSASLQHFNQVVGLGGGTNGTQIATCTVFDGSWGGLGNLGAVSWQLISDSNTGQFTFYILGGYGVNGANYAVQDALGNRNDGVSTTDGTGAVYNGGILTTAGANFPRANTWSVIIGSGTTIAVTFIHAMPTTAYAVTITCNSPGVTAYATSKTTSGFTANLTSAYNGTFDYIAVPNY